MIFCTSRTTEPCKKYTAEAFHLKNTWNQQGDAVPENAVKSQNWCNCHPISSKKQHYKSSPLKSKTVQGLYGLEPQPVSQRKSREKENLSESLRIKPSIHAYTVYDLSIKLKKFGKGILLSKWTFFPPWNFFCPGFSGFVYCLGVKWL